MTVPVNFPPVGYPGAPGAVELGYAENVGGTPTSAVGAAGGGAGAAVDVLGLVLTLTPAQCGARPVVLEFGGNLQQTAAGGGQALLSLVETTSGATTLLSAIEPLPATASLDAGSGNLFVSLGAERRIGLVTVTRSFKLQFLVWTIAASNATANLLNAGNNPTFIRAVAG